MDVQSGTQLITYLFIVVQEEPLAAKMEVKTSLLDNMIGVGDMVLLEPLTEDTFLENLKNRFDHNEIYVSIPVPIVLAVSLLSCVVTKLSFPDFRNRKNIKKNAPFKK